MDGLGVLGGLLIGRKAHASTGGNVGLLEANVLEPLASSKQKQGCTMSKRGMVRRPVGNERSDTNISADCLGRGTFF